MLLSSVAHRLTESQYLFFSSLERTLHLPLYFYGSIQRVDYFPSHSDIDVAVLSDNVAHTVSLLHPYGTVTEMAQQYGTNPRVIRGHKVTVPQSFDILVFSKQDSHYVLSNLHDSNTMPLSVVCGLLLLKHIHYTLGFLSKPTYTYLKCRMYFCYFNGTSFWTTPYSKRHAQTVVW